MCAWCRHTQPKPVGGRRKCATVTDGRRAGLGWWLVEPSWTTVRGQAGAAGATRERLSVVLERERRARASTAAPVRVTPVWRPLTDRCASFSGSWRTVERRRLTGGRLFQKPRAYPRDQHDLGHPVSRPRARGGRAARPQEEAGGGDVLSEEHDRRGPSIQSADHAGGQVPVRAPLSTPPPCSV